MEQKLIMVGNVNRGGCGQFGYTYYEQGLSPTIAAGTHGYCIGHILVNEIKSHREADAQNKSKIHSI